jgi:hypothetical protein
MTELKVGEIVQVRPDKDFFGACMVVVTEPKAWGCQGYVQSAGVPGQQYIRLKHEDFERTGGMCVWIAGDAK